MKISVSLQSITLCLFFACEHLRLRPQMCYGWKGKRYQKLNQMRFRKIYKRNTTCNSVCLSCPLMLQMSSNTLILLHYNEINIENVLSYKYIRWQIRMEKKMLSPKIWIWNMQLWAISDLSSLAWWFVCYLSPWNGFDLLFLKSRGPAHSCYMQMKLFLTAAETEVAYAGVEFVHTIPSII